MSPAPRKPLRSTRAHEDHYLKWARYKFLRVIDQLAPKVSEDLQAVRPAYDALAATLDEEDPQQRVRILDGIHVTAAVLEEEDGWPERFGGLPAQLRDTLQTWAQTYHLSENWLLDRALRALRYARALELSAKLSSNPPSLAYWEPGQHVPLPNPCSPDSEAKPQWIARAKNYADAVETEAKRAGWAETPHTPHLETHMRWLVRHQVLGLTYQECDHGVNESNVRKAIVRLSKLLPLTLRQDAPGR